MDATLGLGIGVVLGFVLGICASMLAGVSLARLQFKSSTAQYRVEMVKRATSDILAYNKSEYLGPLRDKYRYSMGVVIEALVKGFDCQVWSNDGPWPLLFPAPSLDSDGKPLGIDRWEHFDKYVRPTLTDINAYSFLAKFGHPSKIIRFRPDLPLGELDGLTELCHALEDVVGELDAAWEAQKIEIIELSTQNRDLGIAPRKNSDVESLRKAYRRLYNAWCSWVKFTEQR